MLASAGGQPPASAALQAKADQKHEAVQSMIRGIEQAINRNEETDRRWLRSILDPTQTNCFPTLIKLLVSPHYRSFAGLRCAALCAVQLMLRIAVQISGVTDDADLGMRCLLELVGQELAQEAYQEVAGMAEHGEPQAMCGAVLVLAELGAEALPLEMVPRLLDLFVALPERAEHLVEVALRVHAWGGRHRRELLATAVSHMGGKYLCEVLIQMINRCDEKRVSRALKVLAGCLALPCSESLMYTNDIRVLVEILLRELPNRSGDAAAFACHADCFKALVVRCEVARAHRLDETLQVMKDLHHDGNIDVAVRTKCAEVLHAISRGGG
jgi:hypothetical protein